MALPVTHAAVSFPQSQTLTEREIEAMLAGRLAASSIAMYRRDIAAYYDHCELLRLSPLDHQSLAHFRDHLVQHSSMSPHTINRMLSAVRKLMREAAKRERVPEGLDVKFARVEGVSVRALKTRLKSHSRTRIEPEEMRRLCEQPDRRDLVGLRDAALLATLASSGIRVSELVSLTWSQIKRRKKGYLLLVRGKTDEDYREAHLSAEAYQLLLAWKARQAVLSPYVFTSFSRTVQTPLNKPISTTGAWKTVIRYAKRCGLPHIKPHDFRRFVGTQLAAVDIRKAQKALGHKSIETTARHYVLDELEAGLTDFLY